LPTFSVIVKDDIVLEEGVAYTVALIKDTLKNLKVQVEEEDEETVEVDDSNLLKVSKITDDESNKIAVDFEYIYGTEEDEVTETVSVSINLGRSESGRLVLHVERESGNVLYFKKILNQLKNSFSYAIKA